MTKLEYLIAAFCFLALSGRAQVSPADKQSSKRTKKLYQNLYDLSKRGTMFGHQDDLAYGIGWKYTSGGSDVKYSIGEYPAVFGWDLGHLEIGSPLNIDSVPFAQIRKYIQITYKKGLVNTISWHPHNPVTGESSWSKLNSFQAILPGGTQHPKFLRWLDRMADFLNSLKRGGKIPVILRLYHEHNGSWFWWGKNYSNPEEYKALWQMTVKHLKSKGVHHVLYAYSPDKFSTLEDYLERYPGDDYVDILGFDAYHRNAPKSNATFVKQTRKMAETVVKLADQKRKIAAFTETGLETIPVANWWTEVLHPIIRDLNISYVLVWRNGRPDHFYAPHPKHNSRPDFKKFSELPTMYFEKKASPLKLYKYP